MALRHLAVSATAGAAAVALWPGLAWAYGNFGPPPPSGGGAGLPETVGHQGGASADQPPMGVTNDRPAPGSPETVTESATSCAPGSAVTTALTYVSPSAPPASFGSGPATADSAGGFSVSGTIPSGAAPGTWVIFATCNDASGKPLVYTATIVVPGTPAGSGVRAAATGSAAARPEAAGGSGSSSPTGAVEGGSPAGPGAQGGGADGPGTAGAWTPPASWGTPALRALIAPAVNAAAASAPVVLAVESHPVVAHTSGSLGSTAPWRDGAEGLAGLVGLTGLVRLQRRHQQRRHNRWNSRRRIAHHAHRRLPLTRRVFGSKPRGMW